MGFQRLQIRRTHGRLTLVAEVRDGWVGRGRPSVARQFSLNPGANIHVHHRADQIVERELAAGAPVRVVDLEIGVRGHEVTLGVHVGGVMFIEEEIPPLKMAARGGKVRLGGAHALKPAMARRRSTLRQRLVQIGLGGIAVFRFEHGGWAGSGRSTRCRGIRTCLARNAFPDHRPLNDASPCPMVYGTPPAGVPVPGLLSGNGKATEDQAVNRPVRS